MRLMNDRPAAPPARVLGLVESLAPLAGLIALALAAPVLAVGFDAVRQAWTAIYFDGALLRAFCL